MLQQTQVERVISKYNAFIAEYGTPNALGKAPLPDVLRHWSGLGYNRRAKYLWLAAKRLASQDAKVVWEDLPGVGPYTANAVRVFAFNEWHVLVETNVRTVLLHHLFSHTNKVSDTVLIRYAEALHSYAKKEGVSARDWYAALMDYGTYIKKTHGNSSQRSDAYKKQKPFKGSDREVRGIIVKLLTFKKNSDLRVVCEQFGTERVRRATQSLIKEGIIEGVSGKFTLSRQ